MEDIIENRTLYWGTINSSPVLEVKQWEKNHTIIRIQNTKPEGHMWFMTWKKNGELVWNEVPMEGNEFVISTPITKAIGNYYLQVVEYDDANEKVRVSETIKVKVVISVTNGKEADIDPNIRFLYLQLIQDVERVMNDLENFERESAEAIAKFGTDSQEAINTFSTASTKAIEDFATTAEGAINQFDEDAAKLIDEFRTEGTGYVAQTAHNAQVAQESANSANISANDAYEAKQAAVQASKSAEASAIIAVNAKNASYQAAVEAMGYRDQTYQKAQEFSESIDNINDRIDNIIDDDVTTLENTWSSAKIRNELDDITIPVFPNVTIIGQPTINNGQISGFSANNYCQFPFIVNFQNKPFELDFEITTGAEVTQQHNVFDSEFGLAFAVRNSRFVVAISTNGTSWNMGEGVGTHAVNPNSTYRVKMTWDLSEFVVAYSIDGGASYITDITIALTSQPYPKQILIGITSDKSTIFNGIINLNYASLTIANKLVWQGMDDVGLSTRMAVDMSNIDDAGIKKVKELAREELNPDITRLDDRTTILWKLQHEQTMDILTDSTAGDKVIPKGTVGSNVTSIGGMSRKGKNLLPIENTSAIYDDVYTVEGTKISIDTTNKTKLSYPATQTVTLPAGTYTITRDTYDSSAGNIYFQIGSTSDYSHILNNVKKTFVLSEASQVRYLFAINAGAKISINIQCTLGENADTDFEPYTTNLIHAKVDEVVSVGKNICVELFKGYPSTNGGISFGNFTSGVFYGKRGWEVTKSLKDSSLSMNRGTLNLYENKPQQGIQQSGVNIISGNTNTITLPYDGWYLWYFANTLLDTELQIELGSEATSFVPYHTPETTPIPQTILDLPDYGAGIGNVRNEVDYANRKYWHRAYYYSTKRPVAYSKTPDGTRWVFANDIRNAKAEVLSSGVNAIKYIMCTDSRINLVSQLLENSGDVDNVSAYGHSDFFEIRFRPLVSNYPTIEEAYAWAMSLSFIVSFMPEEIVNLDDILPKDYLLFSNVEPNGQIKFNYPDKETYPIDVPNTIDNYRKLSDI